MTMIAADPMAFRGWARTRRGRWTVLCSHADEDGCWTLLLERTEIDGVPIADKHVLPFERHPNPNQTAAKVRRGR